MRNGRTEKHFDLNKTNKKQAKLPFVISFYFQIIYVFVQKSQQLFHITSVINVIIILVGAHKNYKTVQHRVAIIAQ